MGCSITPQAPIRTSKSPSFHPAAASASRAAWAPMTEVVSSGSATPRVAMPRVSRVQPVVWPNTPSSSSEDLMVRGRYAP